MSKNESSVMMIVADTIEIGIAGEGGTEPETYEDVGFFGEKVVEYKIDPVLQAEGGGGQLQKAGKCEVKIPCLQFLDGSYLEETFKNKRIWAKVTPTGEESGTNPVVKFMNFLANFSYNGDLSAAGESIVTISGTKLVTKKSDFMVETGSYLPV